MSEKAAPQKKIRRRQYVVDWRLQMVITAQLLGVLAGVGVLYAIALIVLPGKDALLRLSADEVRTVLLRANLIYFALGAAILGVLAVLLTHRVAGPASVLERVVQGMRKGQYTHRVSLRRNDYLKDLATAIGKLREEMQVRDDQHRRLCDDLTACLGENDLDAAGEILAQLKGGDAKKPAPQPAPEQPVSA